MKKFTRIASLFTLLVVLALIAPVQAQHSALAEHYRTHAPGASHYRAHRNSDYPYSNPTYYSNYANGVTSFGYTGGYGGFHTNSTYGTVYTPGVGYQYINTYSYGW